MKCDERIGPPYKVNIPSFSFKIHLKYLVLSCYIQFVNFVALFISIYQFENYLLVLDVYFTLIPDF